MTIFPNPNPAGFMRLKAILAIMPVSKTTWWAGVKSGRFPKPVKISDNITAWRTQDIHDLIQRIESANR